ncbi:MAG: FlgD immunoglobulin-like domain containing protein [Candidatus Zixiibacteriota bacterium]
MRYRSVLFLSLALTLSLTSVAAPPNDMAAPTAPTTMTIDKTSFIDANKILMFVTNFGNFGRDLDAVFGHDYGTFYPYIGTEYIEDGRLIASPLYAAGLWFGAIDSATGETRVVISEYGSEYTPGPMEAGTFQPDCPEFQVYKLYHDSLQTNPNSDYLNWPVDQGAPVDEYGRPLMRGHQTLWTVFNDADPAKHTNDAGDTNPLGIEVRLMAWAMDEPGVEVIPGTDELAVTQVGTTTAGVTVRVVDPMSLTGHDYMVVIDSSETLGPVWHLIDQTTALTVRENIPVTVVDTVLGLEISVDLGVSAFSSFEVVANAAGVLDPPEPGALAFAGFPVPTEYDPSGYISDRQQSTDDGQWAIHTDDNGGTSGGGTRGSYDAFLDRVTRTGANYEAIGCYDYEMRFTGSYDNYGTNGSYVFEWYNDENVFWVPFELWQIGIGTPDDPSDDVRLIPIVIDDGDDDTYNLESYGSSLDLTCAAGCEHSASGGDDDPFTDWTYWIRPVDSSPGEAGYLAAETDMLAGTFGTNVDSHYATEILARIVLINWNGGVIPPFTMDLPEQGTIFRICTTKEQPRDTFTFTATAMPDITTGDEGLNIYLEYWVHNKGGRTLNNSYISLWSDPDLGGAGDDLVGCDSLNNLFFCYNADDDDTDYGTNPPAMGFKYLVGPLVPWQGETADFYGEPLINHKDIGMTGFIKYFNGTDPDNFSETYQSMQTITKGGDPYIYDGHVLMYMHSGDPVAATGDLDMYPADRRMMGNSGPFTFRPGDSLYMLIRMTAKHGTDYLNAITELKRVLNLPVDLMTDVPGETPGQLPDKFAVKQNYPNPFNPSTTIQYSLPERTHVTIDIYNLLGQKVRQLVDEMQTAGEHTVLWDGNDEGGNGVATGMYFYRVKAGDFIDNKKMLLVK